MSQAQQRAPVRYIVFTWVPDERLEEWNAWHNDVHIPEVLATGLMRSARKYRVHETSFAGEWQPQYATVYELDSLDDVQAYVNGPGQTLREDYHRHYGAVGRIARMVLVEERQF
ncbi:DUF4286 family protein [Kallotenue papyrolyticum]|uniref:DUF4286 family protein n=1 Tax=Kallotenue papyrolyticum TaxID=1325125 RepID=UPI0004785313|nr:DUF4286 family protein [Kallotenue papyrolyticum]